jgi:DNA-binding transcriptional regulator LsrR (DeoR family)
MSRFDEQRLMVRVAQMYYQRKMSQSIIANQLGLSQATVSRLLRKSIEEEIVRISVNVPQGVYTQLEEELIDKYDLLDAVVVDSHSIDNENIINRDIGSAAAYYIETILKQNDLIGISSWSSALLGLVDAMHPVPKKENVRVIQILGGVGNPSAELHANRLTTRFARLVNGDAIFLPAPGVVGSPETLDAFYNDEFVKNAISLFDEITIALVGIGAVEPSPLLAESGNIFSNEELETLQKGGAVGDILLHFFDEKGKPTKTFLDNRVASMELQQLKKTERSIGVAGGTRKLDAIRGALIGKWINVLVTDKNTAANLV